MEVKESKTHVIVGGGTSGLVLCHQLLRAGHKVILLDKGRKVDHSTADERTWLQKWLGLNSSKQLWTFESHDVYTTRQIFTTPQRHLNNRYIEYCLGHGLGGTSNINAMMFDMGNDEVFNQYWPSNWSAKVMKRYAKEVEEIIHASEVHTSGNMEKILSTACKNKSYKATVHRETGFRWRLESILKSEWMESGQLVIYHNCDVRRVIIAEGTATAVEVMDQLGQLQLIYPNNGGEIILCAGVFGSPEILQRSLNQEQLEMPLYDHVILPYILVGNWFTGWKEKKDNGANRYPINSVHGWIMLDSDGNVLEEKRNDDIIPT